MLDVHEHFKKYGFISCYTDLGWDAKLFVGDDEKKNHYTNAGYVRNLFVYVLRP